MTNKEYQILLRLLSPLYLDSIFPWTSKKTNNIENLPQILGQAAYLDDKFTTVANTSKWHIKLNSKIDILIKETGMTCI